MRPVFIGGCPRSGTTLLGAMLGAHDQLLTIPESQFMMEVLRSLGGDPAQVDTQEALARICRHWRFKVWELEIDQTTVPTSNIGGSYDRLIKWIVGKYGDKHERPDPPVWVDHTPNNVRVAGKLFDLFPDAKMIHIVRDGRAAANSVMPLDWGPSTISAAATWWVRQLAFGLAAENFWGDGRVRRVRYEDLVTEPETTLKGICGFLEIDYQEEMMDGSGFAVPPYTANQHTLVGGKPDARALDRWMVKLKHRDVEIFEALTGDLLRYLGYAPKFGFNAKKPNRSERLVLALREVVLDGIHTMQRRFGRRRRVLSRRRS